MIDLSGSREWAEGRWLEPQLLQPFLDGATGVAG